MVLGDGDFSRLVWLRVNGCRLYPQVRTHCRKLHSSQGSLKGSCNPGYKPNGLTLNFLALRRQNIFGGNSCRWGGVMGTLRVWRLGDGFGIASLESEDMGPFSNSTYQLIAIPGPFFWLYHRRVRLHAFRGGSMPYTVNLNCHPLPTPASVLGAALNSRGPPKTFDFGDRFHQLAAWAR